MPEATRGQDNPFSQPFTLQAAAVAAGDGDFLLLPEEASSSVTLAVSIGAGGAVLPEVSLDAVTWFPIFALNLSTGIPTFALTVSGPFVIDTSGWIFFRARVTAGPGPITVLSNDVAGAPASVLSTAIAAIVLANQGAPAALVNAWPILVTDGVDTAQVLGAHPAAAELGLTVRNIARRATATVTVVPQSAVVVPLLAANAARLRASVHNEPTANRTLIVKLGAGAEAASFSYKLSPGEHKDLPEEYNGIVTGIWTGAGAGNAFVTEIA